jgi:hypothetical protein
MRKDWLLVLIPGLIWGAPSSLKRWFPLFSLLFFKARPPCHPERSAAQARAAKDLLLRHPVPPLQK